MTTYLHGISCSSGICHRLVNGWWKTELCHLNTMNKWQQNVITTVICHT